MLRNVVVGYDGSRSSEVAVEQAIALAETTGGRLFVVTVSPVTEADVSEDELEGEPDIVEMALPPQAPGEENSDEERFREPPLNLDEIHRRCQDLHIGCEEERLFGRRPGTRLLRRSWTADLLVIGRGDERRPGVIGRNATFLLSELVAPTLVCAREYVEMRSVLIPYKLSVRGGRALSFAAGLCEMLNAELTVLVCAPRRASATEAAEAAAQQLRAYHVEHDIQVSLKPPHEALHSAAGERETSLVIVPGAHKRYYVFPWQRNETLWRALEVPGAAVLAYP